MAFSTLGSALRISHLAGETDNASLAWGRVSISSARWSPKTGGITSEEGGGQSGTRLDLCALEHGFLVFQFWNSPKSCQKSLIPHEVGLHPSWGKGTAHWVLWWFLALLRTYDCAWYLSKE